MYWTAWPTVHLRQQAQYKFFFSSWAEARRLFRRWPTLDHYDENMPATKHEEGVLNKVVKDV